MTLTKEKTMDLSIIIVAYNVKELVDSCLEHIAKSKDLLNKEIIFVDNGSDDGTKELVKQKYPEVVLIESPENLGFIRANNLGYRYAHGKYILMLNSDAFIGENTLQVITDFMEKTPDCGVLGCRAVNGEGTLLPSARYFPTPWRIFLTKMGLADKFTFWKNINDMKKSHDIIRECDWVTGCCLLVRKNIVDEMGSFLRSDFFMYNDDNDLCYRIKKRGWKVVFHPETIVHLNGANNKKIAKKNQDTSRIKRLTLDSDYVYFRHNYNVLWVFYHCLMVILFNLIQLGKRFLLFKKTVSVDETIEEMKLAIQLLLKTHLGKTSTEKVGTQTDERTHL